MHLQLDLKTASTNGGVWQQIVLALQDRSYLCLHAGFFTCGFHVAFLITHLPGEVALSGHSASVSAASIGLIGLFNIAGSLIAGGLGSWYRMKYILAFMYGSRAVMIAVFLAAPKTTLTFYVFAAALGLTWLATVPPTAGLVGKLFGTRYLAHTFRVDTVDASDRRFSGSMARRTRHGALRELSMDVVRRYRAGHPWQPS